MRLLDNKVVICIKDEMNLSFLQINVTLFSFFLLLNNLDQHETLKFLLTPLIIDCRMIIGISGENS